MKSKSNRVVIQFGSYFGDRIIILFHSNRFFLNFFRREMEATGAIQSIDKCGVGYNRFFHFFFPAFIYRQRARQLFA